MSDDATKQGADRRTVSGQAHELRYLHEQLALAFPAADENEIDTAIAYAREHAAPSEGRELILNAAVRRLKFC